MKRRPWRDDELELLRKLYPDTPTKQLAVRLKRKPPAVYQKAQLLGLVKSEAYLASPHACRLRRGDNVGARTRFPKGHAPANKGLRRPGWFRGRMRETQFKKGQRRPDTAPIGATRLIDGYVYVKVSEISHVPYTVNWKLKHILEWQRVNGEVPPGYCLVFRDRNRLNTDVANLELISRADNMRRNSYHNRYPKEIGLAIQARGALNRMINKRAKA